MGGASGSIRAGGALALWLLASSGCDTGHAVGSAGGSGQAAPCPREACATNRCTSPGLSDCGERCVDLSRDPLHCGRCGFACAPWETCTEGDCVPLPNEPPSEAPVRRSCGLEFCPSDSAGDTSADDAGVNADAATRSDAPADASHDPAASGDASTPAMDAAAGEDLSCQPSARPACGASVTAPCPPGLACVESRCTHLLGDKRWLGPDQIGDAALGLYSMDFKLHPAGAAIVCWRDVSATGSAVRAALFDPVARSWGPVQTVSGLGQVMQDAVRCAINERGDAVVVYTPASLTSYTLWANHYDARAGAFLGARAVDGGAIPSDGSLNVGIDAQGNSLIVFRSGEQVTIDYARYRAGTDSWSTPQLLSEPEAHPNSGLLVLPDGTAFAAWNEHVPGSEGRELMFVVARFEAESGSWQPPVQLSGNSSYAHYDPKLAADAAGNLIVQWQDWSMWAARYDAACGHFGEAVRLAGPESTPADLGPADLSVDRAGNALLLWARGGRIEGSRYDATRDTWSAITDSGELSGLSMYSPRVALSADGYAIAAYRSSDRDSGLATAFTSLLDAGAGAWGPAQALGPADMPFSPDIALGIDSRSRVLATFTHQEGDLRSLMFNRFE